MQTSFSKNVQEEEQKQREHDPQFSIGAVVQQYITELDDQILKTFEEKENISTNIVPQKFIKQIDEEPVRNSIKLQTLKTIENLPMKSMKEQQHISTQKPQRYLSLPIHLKNYLNYLGNFNQIKYHFLKLGNESKMTILKDQNNSIIIKKNNIDSWKCVLKMCFPTVSQQPVYQLINSTKSDQKAKVILISGDQRQFKLFKKQFLYQLWLSSCLHASLSEIIDFSMSRQEVKIEFLKKLYKESYLIYESRRSDPQALQIQLQGLMQRVRETQNSIKKQIIEEGKIMMNNSAQKLIHQKLFTDLRLGQFYKKMLLNENLRLEKKKSLIKSTFTPLQAVKYLQADKRFYFPENPAMKKKITECSQEQTPFKETIFILDQLTLDTCPLVSVQKITKFGQKLKYECFKYHKKLQKLIDMDEQLPVIIFCCLMSKNKDLKFVINYLLHYFEKDDYHEPEKRIIAALNASLDFIRSEWKIEST